MSALLQQSPEWLELRRTKIGASDSPIIMGVSPWKTPRELWCEKVGISISPKRSPQMKRGLDKEAEARREFEKQTGILVFPAVVFSDKYDFMMASLDGMDIDRENIVEIKVPGKEDHEMAMDGVIPEKYIPQLMKQMIVCNLDHAFYFSWNEKSSKVIEIEKNSNYCVQLIAKETEFWSYVEDFIAPPLTEMDLKKKDTYLTREDDLWTHSALQWKEASTMLKHWKEKEEEARQNLIHLSGKSNVKGAGIELSKVVRKGSINYQEIPQLLGVNLEQYRKAPVETWRLGEI